MGDKSPKSKQKNQNQKTTKASKVAAEKQRVIDSKKPATGPTSKNR